MQRRRGFNLIEAAIVLGVIGMVLGGIWVAASAVQANLRKSNGSRGLIQIVQNVRNLYANQTPSVAADITAQLISARAVPADFVQGTVGINPWNGNVVVGLSGSGSADTIDVTFSSVPQDVCIELTSRNTNVSTSTGLTQILISNGTSTVTVSSFPYLPATASTDCLTTNSIKWSYNLR